MSKSREYSVFGIDCRSVGPGGSSVDFYPHPSGLWGVWTNENCPYDLRGEKVDGKHAAICDDGTPGHNVSVVPWADIIAMIPIAQKWAGYQPKKKAPSPPILDKDWTDEECDIVLGIALQAEDPDMAIQLGGAIVAALRSKK